MTYDAIVVGGGPAGSVAAATMARSGARVLLLEAGEHPRPHVGESLLPGIIPVLDEIGVLGAIERAGFAKKTGSTLWNWGRTPRWDLWFADSDAYEHAWFVDRSRFDALLFEHARASGAQLRTKTAVRKVRWNGERAVGVDLDGEAISARVVIDASGQSCLIGRAQREAIDGLRHQAMWAHFEGVGRLPPPRERQALFVAQPRQWWWLFPLAGGRASVGVVQLDGDRAGAPRRDFDDELASCRELREVLGPNMKRVTPIRRERDWSYRCPIVAGPGWLSVGDAAGFIDPVLSTGVMLAVHSGWHAARAATGASTYAEYQAHHREMFDDLLRMVTFYYQQNLERDDYFWESKQILQTRATRLKPQRAFIALTSGLVQNLALDEKLAARQRAVEGDAPVSLDFVCVHLKHESLGPLYFLIEPVDSSAPTLFRTPSWHLNAIAPRHGNDPISVPGFESLLRTLADRVRELDDRVDESLAAFWRRAGQELAPTLRSFEPAFEVVRVFGQ